MGVLRSECDDQIAVPFVSMSVVGGGVRRAADIVNQQVTVKRHSALQSTFLNEEMDEKESKDGRGPVGQDRWNHGGQVGPQQYHCL